MSPRQDSLDERRRRQQRGYAIVMGTCVFLILMAWTVVRLFSTPAAVAMSVVAMVLPPIAAILGNAGE